MANCFSADIFAPNIIMLPLSTASLTEISILFMPWPIRDTNLTLIPLTEFMALNSNF